MPVLRKLLRMVLVFAWFGLITPLAAIFIRGRNAVRKAGDWTRLWARGTARIAGLDIRVEGGDPGRFSGGLVVGNHQSYLDILVHASLFPLRFAPKIEMRKWPLLGFMTSLNRPIWIDRSSRGKAGKTAAEMEAAMHSGSILAVYPEGTTSDGKNGLLPFKSTPFEAVAADDAPILPTLFFYRPEPEERVAWIDDDPLLPHVWRILGLKRIGVTVYIMPEIRRRPGEDRKSLALRVHEIMNREYERRLEEK